MKTNKPHSNLNKQSMYIGVLALGLVVILGFGLAFATGLTAPHAAKADDIFGDSGSDFSLSDSDASWGIPTTDDSGDFGTQLGSSDGSDWGIPATSDTAPPDVTTDTPPDVTSAPCDCGGTTPATVDTTPSSDASTADLPPDVTSEPCDCGGTIPATVDTTTSSDNTDAATPPDVTSEPCDCGGTTPVTVDDTPPDVTSAPCDCGGEETPVEVDTPVETPVIDTPPVDVIYTPPVEVTTPPVIVTPPPVIVTPPPTPVCNAGFSGTYPNCVPISTPPVIVPPVIIPPVITPPVITPPVITPPSGGGGGGQIIPPPVVTFSGGGFGGGSSGQILPPAPVAPIVSSVYLSQIPYTGLDLGPVGTVVYWVLLVLICAAAAYLILFQLLPWIIKGLQSFGSEVGHSLNQPAGAVAFAGAAHGTTGSAHEPSQQIHATAPQTHVVQATTTVSKANPSAYSAAQGFSSFAQNGSLTIDDIVNGLARLPEMDNHQTTQTTHTEAVITPTPVEAVQAPVYAAPQFAQPARAEQPAAGVSTDVRDFCAALLQGNRDVVFATIRQIVREGGDAEMFITQVVCAFDDAYRNRVEGTKVNGEIAQLTQNCATPFLERLMNALTNAVDSSYSPGISGSKLALTRALAVVEG